MNLSAWKEKVLANLDKICLDPVGNFANSESVEKYWTWGEYYDSGLAEENGQYRIKTETGEEINLRKPLNYDSWWENYVEIRTAVINNIKRTPTNWEITEDSVGSQRGNFIRNKKNGLKHYKSGIVIFIEKDGNDSWDEKRGQRDWDEIKEFVKNSSLVNNDQPKPTKSNPTKNELEKKWYKLDDYPFPWVIGIILTLFFLITVVIFTRKSRKRKDF